MDKLIDTEIMWLGDQRITRTYEGGRLVKTQEHVKHYDGSIELIFEEFREYHSNGNLKEIWNSNGDFFEFDKRGNFID